ncbi:hypothetical protein O0L34_g9594 [Tuta absoluta]|nr:hypothetical protein O0L34_g9594 [Tuta absoluta]
MYYSCHCIKRNGLQHDCRRTGCGGEPTCLTLPDPVCAPSQLARARGLADPAALAPHYAQQYGGGQGGYAAGPSGPSGSGGGKRFIVCELKGTAPGASAEKSGKCCKCPRSNNAAPPPKLGCCQSSNAVPTRNMPMMVGQFSGGACVNKAQPPPQSQRPLVKETGNCGCSRAAAAAGKPSDAKTVVVFDEQMTKSVLEYFGKQDIAKNDGFVKGPQNKAPPLKKSEPCTRPGCIHWQPPSPCVWDLPCKADCFETPAGIRPGRNPWVHGSGPCVVDKTGPQKLADVVKANQQYQPSYGAGQTQAVGYGSTPREAIQCMTPKCCTGCCVPSDGGAARSGGAQMSADMPVLVLKLA